MLFLKIYCADMTENVFRFLLKITLFSCGGRDISRIVHPIDLKFSGIVSYYICPVVY